MKEVSSVFAGREALVAAVLERHCSAEERVRHPAWAWQGSGRFATAEVLPTECLWLRVRASVDSLTLGLPLQAAFPTLERLFANRFSLPEALVLAAVERDGGPFFNTLSQLFGVTLQVEGLVAAPEETASLWCGTWQGTEASPITCCLVLTPAVAERMASVGHWVASHPTLAQACVRTQLRLAQFPLMAEELAVLSVGDAIALPEWTEAVGERRASLRFSALLHVPMAQVASGAWVPMGEPAPLPEEDAGMCSVGVASPLHLSVGQVLAWCRGDFEEGVMVAQPAQLVLEVNGRRLAWGRLERFGAQAVLVIDGVEEHASC